MTTVNINWTTVIAGLSVLAGLAGTILTPIYGSNLATSVQAVITALSGLLVVITGYHATSVVAANAKAKAQMKIDVERETQMRQLNLGGYSPPPSASPLPAGVPGATP